MTTFRKAKLKKSDEQTNIDKYRVAANITEYHILSKLIFRSIIIPKFMRIRQLYHVKNVCNKVKINISYMLKSSCVTNLRLYCLGLIFVNLYIYVKASL